MIEAGDFTSGGKEGWLRLDRAGWQCVDEAEVIGSLKTTALGRVHRTLCTHEARTYADLIHRAPTFIPGERLFPRLGRSSEPVSSSCSSNPPWTGG